MSKETTRCDFCHAAVYPHNQLADTHICKPCLKDFQVCERVDNE